MFEKKKKKLKYVIIVGCGRLGANLADTLSNMGKDVLVIDENRENFKRLSSNFGGLVLEGNGTDINKLKEAKIQNASSIIAVTNNDNTNIMIAQMAREIFKVEQIIARIYDPECESIYQELGIHTICPSALSSKEISNLLTGNIA